MAGMIIAGKNVFRISGFLRNCADFICAGNDIRESTVQTRVMLLLAGADTILPIAAGTRK